MARPHTAQGTTGHRVLGIVLALELVGLLLVAASLVFLAAHTGAGAEDITGDPSSRRLLLMAIPPLALIVGLALIGARQAVERRAAAPGETVPRVLRAALWLVAAANAAVVASIGTSLYHARMTWVIVGLLLAFGLMAVAGACVRTSRH